MNDYFENCYTEQEIKERFRELAKKYHPDVFLGSQEEANELFKEITLQKDKALINVYNKSGLNDIEIQKKMDDFVNDLFTHGNFSKKSFIEIAEDLAKSLEKKYQYKNPTFGEVFSQVLGSIFKSDTHDIKKL